MWTVSSFFLSASVLVPLQGGAIKNDSNSLNGLKLELNDLMKGPQAASTDLNKLADLARDCERELAAAWARPCFKASSSCFITVAQIIGIVIKDFVLQAS